MYEELIFILSASQVMYCFQKNRDKTHNLREHLGVQNKLLSPIVMSCRRGILTYTSPVNPSVCISDVPIRFESGFKAFWDGFRFGFGFKKIEVESDSSGFGFGNWIRIRIRIRDA